jgi:hypothetical protein
MMSSLTEHDLKPQYPLVASEMSLSGLIFKDSSYLEYISQLNSENSYDRLILALLPRTRLNETKESNFSHGMEYITTSLKEYGSFVNELTSLMKQQLIGFCKLHFQQNK